MEYIIYYLVMGVIAMFIMLSYDRELKKHFNLGVMTLGVLLSLSIVIKKLHKFIKG